MIPKGYKHTEIGILPEDWEVVRLGEVCEIHNGFAFQSKKFKKCGFPIVRISNIKDDNSISLEEIVYFSFDDYKNKNFNKFMVCQNDILVALSGATTGKIGKMQEKVTLYLNQRVGKFQPMEKLSNDFLYHYLLLQSDLLLLLSGGGAQPNLSTKTIKNKIHIPLPPLAEQEKIARVLSTWDTQIQNLKSLIAEKQNLKKGLCQILLSAKMRLVGFDEPWQVVRLGDILEYEQPTKYLVSSTEYDDSYITPVLTAGKTFILGYTDEMEGIYTNLPIILFDDFTTASQYVDFSFKVKSSACKILKLKRSEFNLRVIFETMQRLDFVADDHKRYWISEYQNQEIFLPNAKEQEKIAEILSEADNEITLLTQKLESLKSQKKGLMQKLLNGKARVK
ncbi:MULTISPECIES: restriction endonuclease subunit S [unclassified Helicobacter]|uniref:restriction endonuclease subunit S n=1 Tax=unclassified Helicobacter TaxID=2593540 RepID=UPI000CF15218|nr:MULTISPECIES: restriction endonuclease subunit S [unclassified Helicobacter]